MHRAVLDTNVFLDCWVFEDPAAQPLRVALEARRIVTVRSPATDAELTDVLARPAFGLAATQRDALYKAWCEMAVPFDVGAAPAPVRSADPDDQKFLDLAYAAQARVLFSRDKALLATTVRARTYGLRVAAPAAMASVLLFEDDLL